MACDCKDKTMTRPTTQQLDILKGKLLDRRAALLGAAHEELGRWSEHPIGEIAGDIAGTADGTVAALLTDVDHHVLERYVDAIRAIDAALSRMQHHRFAVCIDCGDDIRLERVAASPTAVRCVRCQQLHDGTYPDDDGIML
jgi:RNA polymerase-binding transcription factor DksA